MKVKYLDAFVRAADEVVQNLSGIPLQKKNVTLISQPRPSFKNTIIVQIDGFISGQVVYSLSEETAIKLVSRWMPKFSIEKVKKFLKSGVGEIANMITGRSTALLEREKQLLYVHDPTIFMDYKYSFDFIRLRTIVVLMQSEVGEIEISLALKENHSNT